jgi:hypothetical protein
MTRRTLTKPTWGAKSASKAPSVADVTGVIDGLKSIAESLHGISQERTKQREIKRAADTEIARIKAMRDVLLDYLERSFDERRRNFDALFVRVDQAMATGDPAMLSATLGAVVALAQSSPFEAFRDVAATREMLGSNKKIDF